MGKLSARLITKLLLRKISYLDISKNPIGQAGIDDLSLGLRMSMNLIHIDVGSCGLNDKGAETLFDALTTNESITSLSMSDSNEHRNKLTSKAWTAMKAMLSENKTLSILNLTNTSLKNTGLSLIHQGILGNEKSSIVSLNLTKNDLTFKCMKEVASLIEDTQIMSLVLNQNAIEDKGVSLLKDSLTKNYCPNIKKLSLEACSINHSGVLHLFKAMTCMVNMSYVNLSQNHFVEATFYPLRSWYGSHLSTIRLNNCWLGGRALASLAEIIRESPSLKTLYLSNNHLGEDSFQIICDALSSPKSSLEVLDVSNNNFDDAGICKIAKAIKTNKSLRSLNLSENNFVYDGALSLIDSLNTNKTLKKLGLSGVILRENLKQRLTEKVVTNRTIIA